MGWLVQGGPYSASRTTSVVSKRQQAQEDQGPTAEELLQQQLKAVQEPDATELLQTAQENAVNEVDAGMQKTSENLAGFSGAVINAQFGGQDVQSKIREATEETAKHTKELIRLASKQGVVFN